MSSTSETETEILLGNRHLLAIFFVLAILLGIAFTGGYMLGRNTSDKRAAPLTASTNTDPTASTNAGAAGPSATSMETHSLPSAGSEQTDTAAASQAGDQTRTVQPPPPADTTTPSAKDEPLLGAPKQEAAAEAPATSPKPQPKPLQPHTKPASAFSGPESGQTFLQVMAVRRTEAEATADVLSKKGFHAHAVPKPGSSDIYRVLIGPMHDPSEISSTRDSLRNVGFTKIFVQRY